MIEEHRYHCISSAVVLVLPDRMADVAAAIERMQGLEIHARENGRIVAVMEGSNVGELGLLLTAIGNLDGVIAANMVFEHVEDLRHTEP
jgi:periplasmic nitrate reductase NapD